MTALMTTVAATFGGATPALRTQALERLAVRAVKAEPIEGERAGARRAVQALVEWERAAPEGTRAEVAMPVLAGKAVTLVLPGTLRRGAQAA